MSKGSAFPSDKMERLALVWLENQDLKGKTPLEILEMYDKAYKELDGTIDKGIRTMKL